MTYTTEKKRKMSINGIIGSPGQIICFRPNMSCGLGLMLNTLICIQSNILVWKLLIVSYNKLKGELCNHSYALFSKKLKKGAFMDGNEIK